MKEEDIQQEINPFLKQCLVRTLSMSLVLGQMVSHEGVSERIGSNYLKVSDNPGTLVRIQ